MKRSLLTLASLLLLAASLSACDMRSAFSRISVEVRQVRVKDFSPEGFSARVSVKADNPNWFTVTVKELNYAVFVNGAEVGRGRIEEAVEIPGNGSAVAELPLVVGFGGLDGSLNEILRDSLVYRVKGEAVLGTLLGSYTYRFDKEKTNRKK